MNYHLNFNLIWRHFERLWDGLILSLELALLSIAIGSIIGLVLAIWYVSGGRIVRTVISAYVEFIRNVPLILLVYLVFYGLPTVVNIAYSPTVSFTVTLSLYSGAYLVEVFRSGLEAVPRGHIDAGKAIGLTPIQRLFYVRLPTMTRITLPALSNTFISLFKDTSVASVISVPELAYGAQWINFNTFRIVEVYLVVTGMYLVTGYTILFGLRALERKFKVER
ncbi:amino acid ABC transporter permease [Brucella anthropi]|uniref:amino acid ABC transporter permease n=1 Tax=Brucella anthropi TaxID=529 RepID=UPI00124DF87C|nr:amino acid ABC transporter permease [Brucella anthropi]KAB2726454.1 amino acid ABC transporter permease [Brucella anthropi]KAB2743616.1 amino acid ABC transporter permease [Brucella anthropi]KAB2804363.1 amino acid ABC transporter permease [Brucella anthropi]